MIKEEIINKYIESEEMRDYLIKNIDGLRTHQLVDIICGGRKALEKKYEDLKLLADNITDECITEASDEAKEAIYNFKLKSGEVFLISERGFDMDILEEKLYGSQPVSSAEQANKFIKEEWDFCTEEENADRTDWYELEKYTPDENGDLQEDVWYMVAPNNEVWFYINDNNSMFNDYLDSSADLNLPVPFAVGDIITIDCRPFAPVKQGVIIEIGDNRDCCSVQCAYISKSGGIIAGALKHASLFDIDVYVRISALYRAEKYSGELADGQEILKDISDYVKDDEKKGQTLQNYIYENDNCRNGVSIEKMLKHLKG